MLLVSDMSVCICGRFYDRHAERIIEDACDDARRRGLRTAEVTVIAKSGSYRGRVAKLPERPNEFWAGGHPVMIWDKEGAAYCVPEGVELVYIHY